MNGLVLLTRAQEDAERSARRLAARGYASLVAPVIRIVPVHSPPPDCDVAGVVVTSRHAVPALASRAHDFVEHLVFAVGESTAAALREAGFAQVAVADGTGASLAALVADRLAPGARLLHVAGRDRRSEPAASLAASGLIVTPWVVYAAEAEGRLPEPAVRALSEGRLTGALHYSHRTVGILIDLARQAGLAPPLLGLRHACLSREIAADLFAWGATAVVVAQRPAEESLFEALAEEWRTSRKAGSPAPQSRC